MYSGAQWEPKPVPPATLPTNSWSALQLDNQNGIAAQGLFGTGSSIGANARGTLLLWHPKSGAFRAGFASNSGEWDEQSLGSYSVAMGYQLTASGQYSTAFGFLNHASGESSTALGESTRAVGYASTTLGFGTKSAGYAAVATGFSSVADGEASFTTGFYTRTTGKWSVALGAQADAPYQGNFVFGDATSRAQRVAPDQPNQFLARASGGVVFQVNPTGTIGCYLSQASGGWQCTSDRAKKTDFRAVNGERLLGTLHKMPMTTWRYRTDSTRTTHLGPTAQDFYSAFGLGGDSLTIGSVDAQGVALAAAKALEARTQTLTAENTALRALVASISARVKALEIHSLAARRVQPPNAATRRLASSTSGASSRSQSDQSARNRR
jgi:hypothetical protein